MSVFVNKKYRASAQRHKNKHTNTDVGGSADKDTLLLQNQLSNKLHQCKRLSCSWRSMNQSNLLCSEGKSDSFLLRRVEGWVEEFDAR